MTPATFLSRCRPGAAGLILTVMVASFLSPGSDAFASAAEATLEGRVMDQTGATVSGVKVTLIGATSRQFTSDKAGKFRATVPEGFYVVTAEKPGFVAYTGANIEMKAGAPMVQEIRLEVARTEAVNVDERASAVSLGASENAGAIVLKESDIEALPDDPDELAAYLQALAGNSGGPNGGQISIDGFTGGRMPSKASIREVRLNSNPFSSEFDRMGFGHIQIFTRPGTDTYRGGASFRFNNDALNTRNPYAPNKPPYSREDYGLEFAGPIAKGKASFSFESDYRSSDDNQTINAVVLDPSLVSTPVALTLTRPLSRLTYSPRIDWQINDKQSLIVRYSHSENKAEDSGIGGFNLPSRGFDSNNSDNNGELTLNSILGRAVNEVRMRYGSTGRDQTSQNPQAALTVQESFGSGGAAVGSRTDGTRFELSDVVSWATRKHAFRSGFRVRRNTTDELSRNNFAGVVTFAGGLGPALDANFNPILGADGAPVIGPIESLERYRRTLGLQARGFSPTQIRLLGGGVSQYTVAGGDPSADVAQTDAGLFFNDDWKKTDRLVLGLGLRAEIQNNLNTRLDLAPRVSFAYSLKMNKDGRTPKSVTRGGIGIFYDRVSENLVLDANRYLDGGRLQYVVTDPLILDSIKVTNGSVVSVPSVELLNRFSQPQNTRVLDEGTRAPRSIQGSVSLEQQMGGMTGSLALIGSRGDHQLRSRNINAVRADGSRPLAGPGAVYSYETTGRNQQFQVVAGLSSRPGRKNSFFVRYFLGWAKGDTDGANTFPAIPTDLEADYGRASSDVRHRVMAGGNIEAPWGIKVGPMLILSTGRPFNITSGRDFNLDTVFSDRPSFGTAGQTAVINTKYGLLNTAGVGQIIPRNYGNGPNFASLSLRLSKFVAFKKAKMAGGGPGGGGPPGGMGGGDHGGGGFMGGGGGMMGGRGAGGGGAGLTFAVNISNLLDRTNEGTPVGNLSSPKFGQSTSLAGFFMGFGPGGAGGGGEAGNRRIELQIRANF